ncbi:hypothetical protein G5T42_02515 [Microbacterium sp. 4R-513]|uniref:hypothetical protein n=1 Tax=Microbacterium sp. 4R-513 TaxID=2567934 RepID=UPI0013E13F2F|nr:hypothetical protein [Microbacterium sp. 4R-513]QIG38492.1 hypothetical protein G5T42_02515 [Microbacterium sp. 4R-513]
MLTRIAELGGRVLRAFFGALLLVRRPRPIHPRGRVLDGWITWLPDAAPSGIAWIDTVPPAPQPVVARLSRSVGLPDGLPDIIGLALRLDIDGRPADLELASTGLGIPSRFMLLPHRSPARARLGTLLPYRGTRGPVLVCARTLAPATLPAGGAGLDAALETPGWRLRLYHATPTSLWHPFADVSLRLAHEQDDRELRFDAGRHPLPGAGEYPWVRALRDPSYRRAQSVRAG